MKTADVGEHINKKAYLKRLLFRNPLSLLPYLSSGLKTFQYRFLYRCIGAGTIVGKNAEIINFPNVKIGVKCLILDNVYIRAGLDGQVTIGDFSAVNSFAKLFGHGGIEVGAYSQIGPASLLTTTSHQHNNIMEAEFSKITIGDWAWLGANVTVLPGVNIGTHSIVGAGSIVTKDIPPYSIAVGNPARVIRENRMAKKGRKQ
jgi:UDP-2-acetamido-3-amino-2,3-dideoxy-glucuronate N-acetyltransferase